MDDRHSYAIVPLGAEEAHHLRRLARRDRSFDALAHTVYRLHFLSSTMRDSLDGEAATGLALAETQAMLSLAAAEALSPGQARVRSSLLRSWRANDLTPGASILVDAALSIEPVAEMRRRAESRSTYGKGLGERS